MRTLIYKLHEKDFMKALVFSMLLIFTFASCTNQNANLFDPGATGATYPINTCYAKCKHAEATDYDVSILTVDAGACSFTACMDPSFGEHSKVLEYQAYVDQFGGTVSHDVSKCITPKTYGTGCSYMGASNFVATSETEGACYFTACTDPDYMEHWSSLGMQAYVDSHPGSTITSDNTLCVTKFSGCKESLATNYEASVLFDDGSCTFAGCADNAYHNFDQAFKDLIDGYTSSLGNCRPFTGSIDKTCTGLLGCTNLHAANYDANALVDNGTCNISCCATAGHENYDSSCQSYIDAYPNVIGTYPLTGVLDNNANCGKPMGCYFNNLYVTNYNAQAKEDGSCNIRCCGDDKALNYNQACQAAINTYQQSLSTSGLTHTGTYDIYATCEYPTPGCSYQNPYVTNWMPNKVENGSCDIQCCGTQGYENYDPKCETVRDEYNNILSGLGITSSGNINTNYLCGKKLGCYYNKPGYVDNYDQNSKENGSCNIKCCATPGYANYDAQCGQVVSAYQSMLQSMGLSSTGMIDTNYNCGPVLGCNYSDSLSTGYVLNYNANAQENGSCNIQCCGTPGTQHYDPKCQQVIDGYTYSPKIGSINNNFNCGLEYGCNYNAPGVVQNYEAGTSENGSCNIQCCSDPSYENYNPSCSSIVNGYSQLLSSLNMAPSGSLDEAYNCGRKKGCTNSYASNYDASAQLEDGSCNISCRVCPAGYQVQTDQACVTAMNSYNSLLSGMGIASTGSLVNTNDCGGVLGCAYSDTRVANYNAQAVENGSCSINCCAQPGYQNYDSNCQATIDSYSSSIASLGLTVSGAMNNNYMCGGLVGCTYASSYTTPTAGATVENGSCSINCCADSTKENYDPNCQSAINNYMNLLNGMTASGTINNAANCGIDLGCNYNNTYVSNYEAGSKENGSCDIKCCALQGYENYDANCASAISGYQGFLATMGVGQNGTIQSNYNCGAQLGCSQPQLVGSNGQPGNASYQEDGSCKIECCSDPNKSNYDANCQSKINAYNSLLAGMGITPSGTSNNNFNCGLELGCSDNRPGAYVNNFTYGAKENGSCNIQCCSQPGYQNYNANCQAYITNYQQLLASLNLTASGTLSSNYNCGSKIGCMDPLAMNYDPQAQIDSNQSCIFKACLTPGYTNYGPDQPIRDAYIAYGSPVGQLYAGPCGPKICPSGFVPVGNTCQCPTGQVLCHGQCLSACPSGYVEQGGTCVCAPGTYQNNNGYCQ